jgi:1-acyl-sn-glycerol-3-phosphate acyltransferase
MEETKQSDPLAMGAWYRIARGIIGFLFKVLSHLEVEGLEHLPDRGPYLIVANHLHWVDAGLLMAILPFRTGVFAGEKWGKHWLTGPLMRSFHAIFVNRGEVDRRALRQALNVLKSGGVLGLAPEGTRSKTGGLQHGHNGAAFLAYHAGVRLVPVACTGQEQIFPSLRRLRRARVRVVFGPPFEPAPVSGRVTVTHLQELTEEIMQHLVVLLPPEYHGVYAKPNSHQGA